MDTLKTTIIAIVAAFIVSMALIVVTSDDDKVGGVPGVSLWPQSVQTFTQGGGITATTSSTTAILLATDIDTENVVEVTPANGATTLTLPATSTMTNIIPNAGDTRTIWIRNATTSASTGLTIAAGTGMTLKNGASSTALLVGDTDGDNTMRVDMVRKSDSDINVYMYKFQD